MLVQIVTENGQKKMIPLTADAGAGNPVGTIIPMYKKSSPSGYLYCDGSTFDQTKYPLLYAYLGSNVLPDYREAAIVGAEQNTTDTIATHDVFTEGEFKDDQLQKVTGDTRTWGWSNGAFVDKGHQVQTIQMSGGSGIAEKVELDFTKTARAGTVTRGKRKAVYFYIKATSGLSENAQDNVVAQLNEERSYSTSEINTGKKWIDGKPIYRKVMDFGALPNNGNKIIAHNVVNLGTVTKIYGSANYNNTIFITLPMSSTTPIDVYINGANLIIYTKDDRSGYYGYIILEYTKTTD